MSATRASPTAMQPNQPDVSPGTSQTPSRANEAMLADELSNIGDLVKWPRAPELREFEQMASLFKLQVITPWANYLTPPPRSVRS